MYILFPFPHQSWNFIARPHIADPDNFRDGNRSAKVWQQWEIVLLLVFNYSFSVRKNIWNEGYRLYQI
jgi:hypothetical protein